MDSIKPGKGEISMGFTDAKSLKNIFGSGLPSRAVSVYMYLQNRANADRQCWPPIPTIAADLNMSYSTVQRALADLVTAGFITKAQRYYESGARSATLYTLIK